MVLSKAAIRQQDLLLLRGQVLEQIGALVVRHGSHEFGQFGSLQRACDLQLAMGREIAEDMSAFHAAGVLR